MDIQPTVTTTRGTVRGGSADGVSYFRGLPYAAPPVGELRFAAPQPPEPYGADFDATVFGPPAPQFSPLQPVALAEHRGGDDWLTLNVFTPDSALAEPGPGLPVLVWIHGGSYIEGSAAEPIYDGAVFAREGFVVVTLNYRLGIDGFAALPEAPLNRGLLDQIAALQWVQDTIADFGGDPAQVTVFGESAGAGSIHMLLTMPEARGLVHRAILQSPPNMVLDAELAADVTGELAVLAGIAPTRAAFAQLSPQQCSELLGRLVTGQMRFVDRWGRAAAIPPAVFPVADSAHGPADPFAALRSGSSPAVDVIVGSTAEEFWLFLAGRLPVSEASARHRVELVGPAGRASEYLALMPAATPVELFERVQSDRMFTTAALDIAEATATSGGRAFVYLLGLQPEGGLGAAHALDVPVLFDSFNSNLAQILVPHSTTAARAVGRKMREAWTQFARSGNPGWPQWGAERLTRIFDTDSRVDTHPFLARWELFAEDLPAAIRMLGRGET